MKRIGRMIDPEDWSPGDVYELHPSSGSGMVWGYVSVQRSADPYEWPSDYQPGFMVRYVPHGIIDHFAWMDELILYAADPTVLLSIDQATGPS